MIKKINKKLEVQENKVLLSNFLSLSSLQMVSYILPLITFPYLVQMLGVKMFGVLSLAMAVINFFQILTDYGFNLSATKDISIHRDDTAKIVEIFNSVMIIKFFLMVLSIVILSILVLSFDTFRQYFEVYFLTFGLVVGQVLFPIWFFQGMEKMKYITVLTIISKVIFTVSIFIFVQTEKDYFMVPLLQSLGSIFIGIIALYIIKKDFSMKFKIQNKSSIRHYFLSGWHIFMQQFYVSLYSRLNILILGALTNETVVGYYSIAERIIDIFRQFFKIVSQVYYPYFAKKFSFNPKQSLENLKKVSLVMLLLSFSSMLFLVFFSKPIVQLVLGNNDDTRVLDVLFILTLGVIFIPFFSLFSTVLVAINESKALNHIARNTALLSLLLSPILIYLFEEKGLACLMVFLQATIIFNYVNIIKKVNKSI